MWGCWGWADEEVLGNGVVPGFELAVPRPEYAALYAVMKADFIAANGEAAFAALLNVPETEYLKCLVLRAR